MPGISEFEFDGATSSEEDNGGISLDLSYLRKSVGESGFGIIWGQISLSDSTAPILELGPQIIPPLELVWMLVLLTMLPKHLVLRPAQQSILVSAICHTILEVIPLSRILTAVFILPTDSMTGAYYDFTSVNLGLEFGYMAFDGEFDVNGAGSANVTGDGLAAFFFFGGAF